jgi:DNA-binding transcriptional LysR family regulator
VHHTRDVLIGTLRLGVSLSAQHLVPLASYLGEFTRDHPGIDLRLRYAPALTMISMVGTGELDCVIGPAVSQVPGVWMTRLAGEPLHLICRADHRLAEQAVVSLSQLAGGQAHLPDPALGERDQSGSTAVRRSAAAHPPRGRLAGRRAR